MKLYPCTTYNVELGTGFGSDMATEVIDRLHQSNDLWESEDGREFEIEYSKLQELIDAEENEEVKDTLQTIYDEGDKRNTYVRLTLSV